MKTKANNNRIQQLLREGNYIVNRDGTVYSKISKRNVGYTAENGYRFLTFNKNDKIQIHRLVYAVYGEQPLNDTLVINHKNGIKTDNRIENLEQVTEQYNLQHTYRVLKYPAVKGNKKITQEIADKIRELHNSGVPYSKLGKQFNLTKSSISYIVNHKTWVKNGKKTGQACQGSLEN